MKISKLYFIVMEYFNLFPDIFTKPRKVFESVLSRVPNQESIAIRLMAVSVILTFLEKAKNSNLGKVISNTEISVTGLVFTVIFTAIIFFVVSPFYKIFGKVFGGRASLDDNRLAFGYACNPLVLPLIMWRRRISILWKKYSYSKPSGEGL